MGAKFRYLCLLIFLVGGVQLSAQKVQFGIYAGPNFGGPIPRTLNPDSSSGTPLLSFTGGPAIRIELNKKWSLQAELNFAGKGADYSQWYHRDTLVLLELIPGRIDTVPSYYRADINGKMRLGYLDIPLLVNFHPNERMRFGLGLQPSFLVSGQDTGTVQVKIGDGTLFPDEFQQFDNIDDMNRFGLGLSLQASYSFPFGLELGLKADRALIKLYKDGFFERRGFEDNPMYHTQFAFRLGWWW